MQLHASLLGAVVGAVLWPRMLDWWLAHLS